MIKQIDGLMQSIGISYAFDRWNSDIVYPYWIGKYQEVPISTEDGLKETVFELTGYTRNRASQLEIDKQKIEKALKGGVLLKTENGRFKVTYQNAMMIPTNDSDLKKIQINLKINEWRFL